MKNYKVTIKRIWPFKHEEIDHVEAENIIEAIKIFEEKKLLHRIIAVELDEENDDNNEEN